MLISKFNNSSLNNFSQKDAIDLLVLTVCPRKNTDKITSALIDKFGCRLSNIINADVSELRKIEGINIQQAEFIHMLPTISRTYARLEQTKRKMKMTPKNMGAYAVSLALHRKEEVFYAISLDKNGYIISEDMIGKGDISNVGVNIKALSKAILTSNAHAVILVHNHPDGDACPSLADIEATKLLAKYICNVRIMLIDHIIVNNNSYYSMRSQYPEIFYSDEPDRRSL